jgi:hypothetical protein
LRGRADFLLGEGLLLIGRGGARASLGGLRFAECDVSAIANLGLVALIVEGLLGVVEGLLGDVHLSRHDLAGLTGFGPLIRGARFDELLGRCGGSARERAGGQPKSESADGKCGAIHRPPPRRALAARTSSCAC